MSDYETITYYDLNAKSFVEGTVNVDFKATQNRFLNKLSPNDVILDFGCGSGRDSKFFLTQGFRVDATDGSSEL